MLAPRKVLWSTPDIVIDRIAEIILTSQHEQELRTSYNLDDVDTIVDIGCGTGHVLIRLAEKINISGISNNHNHHHPTSNVKSSSYPRFIGIDIDEERIQIAQATWKNYINQHEHDQQNQESMILSNISMEFYCMNAILHPEIWMNPSISIIYIYLTPRGMKQLLSIIVSYFNNDHDTNYHCNNDVDENNENCNQHHDNHQQQQQQQRRRKPLKVISYMNPFPSLKDMIDHTTTTTSVSVLLRHKEYVTIPHRPDTAYPIYFYEIG